ncbi:histidine kinase [Streptomyces lucensis JCM 4490]|uniref:Histidine kinase n=1 Tax=Streptomyces lucensis JCM 4490 TaxID=1306176 RepID=A0A918J8P9_9ACTN|nr:SpoIIE family protein phosphatase [Streptomyces lucensis]GGW60479.1 histidine kinase [Streptomyces lucensis JCM 4490]
MCRTGDSPDPAGAGGRARTAAAFSALLEDSAEELYESAPCGYLSTLMDGTIAKINRTLLDWLGLEREDVVGSMRFTDLLTVGGKLYHETHFAPLLRMQGELRGIALEIRKAGGGRLPVLVSSVVKYGTEGQPLLIRTTVFDASDRRAYEEELLRRRQDAERARAEAERARAEAEEAHRQAEADRLRLADALAVLQQSLLPEILPVVPGVETAVHYHTASPDQLGGDFYDVFPVDGTRWAFFLGDVCGKGPQAAALTSLTRYTLRAAAHHNPVPAAALTTLNTVLHDRYTAGGDPRYCTCVFGILEPGADGSAAVHLASGGHPPAIVLRADGRAELLPTPGGLLVGILPDAPFVTATATLAPGDTILLYTDGLTEARTGPTRDHLYGEDALLAFAADQAPAAPGEVIEALTDLLRGFGDGLDDDTALLALGVPATPSPTGPATNHSR